MRIHLTAAIIATLIATVGRTANAQSCDELAPRIPAVARQAGDLVPDGARLEIRAEGDLDGDGQPDLVLVVESRPMSDSDDLDSWDAAERTVVVALRTPQGYATIAIAPCMLEAQGTLGVHDGGPEVSIRRGIIVVSQAGGSADMFGTTRRFRYDRSSGRVLLIGQDSFGENVFSHEGETTSTNYLTGERARCDHVGSAGGRVRTRCVHDRVARAALVRIEQVRGEDP